ncbi:HD-GYP domain-containing protein [Reinekea sp.]|uniref:HD-GYP domain-containing protein n=1 Tax=Reinekea sp. TaxID=1970455 RepID=UPI003989BB74
MIKKIKIDHLKPGMYVSDLNNQWVPAGNKSRSGKIGSLATIEKIRKLGITEIYIDTNKGIDCAKGECLEIDPVKQLQAHQFESLKTQSDANHSPKRIPLETSRDNAEKSYSQAKGLIGDILEDIKNGKGIDAQAVDATTDDLIHSLNENENALACLSFIRTKDEYLLEHSVNVGILLGIFCRARRIEPDVMRQVVAGGILHDIGKILVPNEILNKPGKLSGAEWEEMKRHVTYGEQILDVTAGLSDITRSICRQHHERLDGSGYPRNLPAKEITEFGRMSAICDVYDAVTADRVYHTGMAPNDALRKLVEWSIFHLDKELVYDFIRSLSVYPVGTLVELSNGRAGVVLEANRRSPKHPVIKVFYNVRHEHHIEQEIVNLDDKKVSMEIINTLDARALKIDISGIM